MHCCETGADSEPVDLVRRGRQVRIVDSLAIGAFPLLGVVDVRGTIGVELLDVQQIRLKGSHRLLRGPGLALFVEERT